MELLFNNKYRIPTARLQNWNYANEAMYFVTICTKNRVNYFGEIVNGFDANGIDTNGIDANGRDANGRDAMHCVSTVGAILKPTEIGKIAFEEWYKSIELRRDMNLEMGEFVVMPNHIHGIIIIGRNKYNTENEKALHINANNTDANDIDANGICANGIDANGRDAMHCVSTDGGGNQNMVGGLNGLGANGIDANGRDAMHCVCTDGGGNQNMVGGVNGLGANGIDANGIDANGRDAMHCVSTGGGGNQNMVGGVNGIDANGIDANGRDAMHCVSTVGYKNQFGPQLKNLASIIRGYKSAVTTYARKHGIEFDWQPRFHDHVIRTIDDYYKISNYIVNNPSKWQEDKFYSI